MRCGKIKKLIIDYADGLLSDDDRKIVDGHVAKCDRCSSELAGIKNTLACLKDIKPIQAPDHLWAKIEERIEEIQRPSPFVIWLTEILGSLKEHAVPAVSFALILIVSVTLLAREGLFKKKNMNFVDVSYYSYSDISFFVREHKLPSNSAVYQGEIAAMSKAQDEGI